MWAKRQSCVAHINVTCKNSQKKNIWQPETLLSPDMSSKHAHTAVRNNTVLSADCCKQKQFWRQQTPKELLCFAKCDTPHWTVCFPHYHDNMFRKYTVLRRTSTDTVRGARNNMRGKAEAGGHGAFCGTDKSSC